MSPRQYGQAAVLIDEALVAAGYGSCSALARHCGCPRSTVTRWRDGSATPRRERWPAIESFFNFPEGTIAKLVDG